MTQTETEQMVSDETVRIGKEAVMDGLNTKVTH